MRKATTKTQSIPNMYGWMPTLLCVLLSFGFGCTEDAPVPTAPQPSTKTAPEQTPLPTDKGPDKPKETVVSTSFPEGWTPEGTWLVDASAFTLHEDIRERPATDRAQMQEMVKAMNVTFTDTEYIVEMERPSGPPSRVKMKYVVLAKDEQKWVVELKGPNEEPVQGIFRLQGEQLAISTMDASRSLILRRN